MTGVDVPEKILLTPPLSVYQRRIFIPDPVSVITLLNNVVAWSFYRPDNGLPYYLIAISGPDFAF